VFSPSSDSSAFAQQDFFSSEEEHELSPSFAPLAQQDVSTSLPHAKLSMGLITNPKSKMVNMKTFFNNLVLQIYEKIK
jgi:hypothetical protein